MTEQLTLYTNPMSRGRIARWMLEETGQPYDVQVLGYGDDMKSPDYLALNPMGKVPTIKHGDKIVTECAAICAYLADAFPEAGLAPPPDQRADYYRWLFFTAGPLEQALVNKAMGWMPEGEQTRMAGYGTVDIAIDTLEKAVSANLYIAGDAFTAADVYVGSQVGWGMQFETIPPRDAFKAYWERVSARDAYARGNAADDALVPEQPAG